MLEKINSRQAQIWCVRISSEGSKDYWNILSIAEQERAKRFKFTKDYNTFVVAHGILRELLAEELDSDPKTIEFSCNKHGKPFLSNPDTPLYFNISHSKDLALFAISKIGPVGVDVEFMRDNIKVLELAERFFSKTETKKIFALLESEQQQAFFQCWSRKEAFIKAIGKGLAFSLQRFDVAIGFSAGSLLQAVRDSAYNANDWLLTDLPLDPGYVAAVAIKK